MGTIRGGSQAGMTSYMMPCQILWSALQPCPCPPWMVNICLFVCLFFSIDISWEPLGALELPSARVGAWLVSSRGARWPPLVLTNTFPSPNPQNWTNWPLFPGTKIGGASPPLCTIALLFPLASSVWALCPDPFLSWESRMLPDGLLPQYVCLAHSCGCRDLIYREGPVAAATPAPAGLHSPHFGGSLPWQRPPGFSFSIPFCGEQVGVREPGREGCSPWAEDSWVCWFK